MLKKYVFLLIGIALAISSHQAFAEKNYQLTVDENSFDIRYDFEGDVIAMAIDKEAISLLTGTENVKDTKFQIILPKDLINAENNAFAVLVNGYEVEYTVISDEETKLTFFVPEFTEEIEIIGTYVVPEFPLGAILVLGSIFGIIIAVQKSKIVNLGNNFS
jgi:predicted secreted protein with PEFG-CTERM motif